MESEFFKDSMVKIGREFATCLLFSQDFGYKTNSDSEIKNFRLVLIQDIAQNYQHAAIITEYLGQEFTDYPQLILKTIENNAQQTLVRVSNAFISRNENDNTGLVFTKSVFLYTKSFQINEGSIRGTFSQYGLKIIMRDEKYWTEYMNHKKPDAFICHDSRDKDSFVRPLIFQLSKQLIKVWYGEFSLTIGDSLIDKIDEGLHQCKFGIVVTSQSFLTQKKWTAREFRSLTTREIDEGRKIILPIWHGVNREQVADYSLDLADKFALNSSEGIERIAGKIINEIRKNEQQ